MSYHIIIKHKNSFYYIDGYEAFFKSNLSHITGIFVGHEQSIPFDLFPSYY